MSPVQQIHGSDILDGTVRNIDLNADTARLNLLTNGGFRIWQRGNGPFTAINQWTADRWQIGGIAGDTISVTRDPSIVAAVTFTKGTGATSLTQQLQASDGYPLGGRTISLSMRVRCNATNAVYIRLNDGTTLTDSANHPGDDTWRTLTVTHTVSAGATIVYVQANLVGSCTAYFANAMLVVGSVAAEYAPLHPADDLARCLRYYETVGITGGNDLIIAAIATAASQTVYEAFPYRVIKPVSPTITLGPWDGPGTTSLNTSSTYSVRIGCTSAAAGAFFCTNGAAGSGIIVEANP